MLSSKFLLFAVIAAASAAPWPSSPTLCSKECSFAGSPKLAFAPGKNYVYSYTGKSRIQMTEVEGATADMEWSSKVELTWLSPCDMAISITDPSIGSGSGSAQSKFLERYPLVVAIVDGRVKETCSHKDDDVWSINMKKGIASAFQNTLPSNSSINSGLNFTETDIIGNCSTHYEVENNGDSVTVSKFKNHKFCQDQYINPTETLKMWPKSPLPLDESYSECKQEIKNGIYSSVSCKDRNVLRPSYGSYKYIEADQESVLRFQEENDQVPQSISNLQGCTVRKTLRYDQDTMKKDPSVVTKLDETLKQVCQSVKRDVKEGAASHVAKALYYLRRVPEEAIPQTLQKIRSGEVCEAKAKLEALFLDTVAFIQESGAVKVMVQELLSGRASGGRAALYAASLYAMPRPCIHSIEALKPLFENYQRFPRTSVAAASMVNTYCKQTPNCNQQAPVRQIAETLSSKVSEKCSSTTSVQEREEALALLKALGNMGVMTSEIARPILQCIEKEDADNSIRAAATQSFRNVQCHSEFHQVTRELVNIALNPRKGTEARIGSYLAAVRCAKYEDLEKIVNKISKEENTQVRGFIMSHLLNVQESGSPYKEDLKYLLTTISLPSNYTTDVRKYSRNIDLSYYAPTFGVGGGMESNIIYAPGSYLPRSLSFNLTGALGGTPFNIGEVGARFEGFEAILEELFGPEGYFMKTPTSKILQDISSSFSGKLEKIGEGIRGSSRYRRSIDYSTISGLLNKLHRPSRKQNIDLYARMNDQEMAFASLVGDLKNIDIDELITRFFDNIDQIIGEVGKTNIDTVRTSQIYVDHYLPTIQGKPLKIKLEGTIVAGIKLESGGRKMIPSVSSQLDGFVGYDFHIAQVGVRMKNYVSTNPGASFNLVTSGGNGFELQIDLPEKMELLNMKSEAYLFRRLKGQDDIKVVPPSVRSRRIQAQSCSTKMVSILGLKVCYDVNMPNIFRSEELPLGPPAIAKVYLEKSDPSMRGYQIKVSTESAEGKKEVNIELETPGSSSPKKGAIKIYHSRDDSLDNIAMIFLSEVSGGVKVEYNQKWTQVQKRLEFNTYFSSNKEFSPSTKTLHAKFTMNDNGQDVNIDTAIHTLGAFKEYVDVAFEASGDLSYNEWSRVPLPKRLRMFESKVEAGRWHMVSFIRKTAESQYSSLLKLGPKGDEMVSVEAIHVIEGSSYQDMTINNDLKVKLGRTQYKKHLSLYYTQEKIGIVMYLARQEGRKLAEWQTLFVRRGQTNNLIFLLDFPAYIKAMKLDVLVDHQGSTRYQTELRAKHGENLILHVTGPVTGYITSKATSVSTQLQIVWMQSQPYTVSTSVNIKRGKQAFAFALKGREEIVGFDWHMATEDEQQTKIDLKLKLLSMIEKDLNILISNKVFHISTNQLIMPKSTSPQRMKGFFDVNFENNKMIGEFAWDVDRNPNKKVKGEVTVRPSSTLQDANVKGKWDYEGKTYQFETKMQLGDPRTGFSGRNSLELDFITSAQKTYKIYTVLSLQHQSSGPKVDTEMKLTTPESQEYTLHSESSLEWLSGQYNMQLITKANVVSPQGHHTSIDLEAKHQASSSQRQAHLQMYIVSPTLQRPIKTRIQIDNQQSEYTTKWVIDMGSPVDGAMYEINLPPEGGIQSFKIELNLDEVLELLRSAERLVSPRASGMSVRSTSTHALYGIYYKRDEHSAHTLSVRSPSRMMEGGCKCGNEECHCQVTPDKGVSDAKYELYAKHHHSDWSESRFEGFFSHPSLRRNKQIDIRYMKDQEKVSGTIELDIFQRAEDKITGKLQSINLSKTTASIEAQLSGKSLKANPKIVLNLSYDPTDTGFDIKFQKTPSSPITFAASGKVDMRFGRNAGASFIVENEGRKVFDVSLTLNSHQSPTCYGMIGEGRIYSSVIGSYETHPKLCKPAYYEVAIKKHGSDRMYAAKIGIKGLKHMELSLSEVNPETEESRALGMVRTELASPSLLRIETKYEGDQLHNIKDTVYETLSSLISSAGSQLDEIANEVLKEGHGPPYAEMVRLWQEIKNEASRIYEDLKYDGVIPKYETIKQWTRSEIVRTFTNIYSKFWSQYARFQHRFATAVSDVIRTTESEFDDIAKIIIEAVMGGARSLQTGEMPESIQKLWNQFKETSIYRTVEHEFDSVLRQYPEEYQGLQEIIRKVKSSLAKDVEKQRQKLIELKRPRQIIYWIINHLNFDRMMFKNLDKIVKNIVQNALFLSVQMEEDHLQLQIPIRRPVYSLPQAIYYATLSPVPIADAWLWSFDAFLPTPADNLIWTYYSLLSRHPKYLLPPYNRTAMVIDSTEVLTFDGAVLRVPHSQCKVLLAQYKSNSLIMQNDQSKPLPHFFLKASGASVEIKPDFTVTLNGSPISGPQHIEGEVKIYKKSGEIQVITPFITLRVYSKSHAAAVEVSGWTFGKVAGLLGTYDGEMGNDRLTPRGTPASSLQELVKSWQEDQSCQTPSETSVSPLHIRMANMIQCYTLFGVRSRCNPVVRQEPFKEMCFASRNACKVAKSYSEICATKGVKMVFPLGC